MNKTSTSLPRVQAEGKTHEEITLESVPSTVMEALAERYSQLKRKFLEEWMPQLLLKGKEEFICLKVYTIHYQVEEIAEKKSQNYDIDSISFKDNLWLIIKAEYFSY